VIFGGGIAAHLLLISFAIGDVLADTLITPHPIHGFEDLDAILGLLRELEKVVTEP
jgi:hypothetical protein